MKRLLTIVLAALMISFVLVSCSGGDSDTQTTDTQTTSADEAAQQTEEAVLKNSDAISFIQEEYTEEELGLADVSDDYSFMVVSGAVEVDGEQYINVVANVKVETGTNEDGQTTYSFTTLGSYFISFDAQTVLSKDMESGEYTELESKYADYSAKSADASTTAEADE